jgi:glycosyltransferase involved in cell wall biosynthesis
MGNVLAYLFARLRRRPVVVTQHVSDVPFKSPVLKFVLWLAYQSAGRIVLGGADQVVFISEEVRQDFAKRFSFKRKPRFIPNGVDATLFCSVDDPTRAEMRQALLGELGDRKIFLFVGRFVEKKGLTVLRKIAVAMPQSLFVLLGQGPTDPREWELENVRVIGALSQNELVRYYQSADLLVLPSVGEGLPLVVQEAMSTGLPVAVSSRTARADSSITEYVYQAPCTDELDEAEVVSRWIAMLHEFCVEASLSGEGREALRQIAVNRWSWARCAEQYAEIYDVARHQRKQG